MANQAAHAAAVSTALAAKHAVFANASSTEAQRKTAELQYSKDVLASAKANGIRTGAWQAIHDRGDPAGLSSDSGAI